MNGRTLSEIAYDTVFLPDVGLSADTIDAALKEAGIDPSNEIERTRFRRLVLAVQPQKKEDELARCRFADEARRKCGPDAEIDLIIQTAYDIEEQYKYEIESSQD
jgi:hypothetical protein